VGVQDVIAKDIFFAVSLDVADYNSIFCSSIL
jgi:hypothetical protein